MGADKNSPKDTRSLEQIQGKYLTFKLASEEYGLEIIRVKEIIGIMPVTTLPKTPPFVKGVVNLRGKVIPVIDLRLKFIIPEKEYDDKTCIIVVEVNHDGDNVQIGIIVDAVSEVINVTIDELEPTPKFGVDVETNFILGMAKSKGSVKTLLDINSVLTFGDMESIAGSK